MAHNGAQVYRPLRLSSRAHATPEGRTTKAVLSALLDSLPKPGGRGRGQTHLAGASSQLGGGERFTRGSLYPRASLLRRLPWCTCVSASARQSRAQCRAREFSCKILCTQASLHICFCTLCWRRPLKKWVRSDVHIEVYQRLITTREWQLIAPVLDVAHVYGDANPVSDAISRGHWRRFRRLCEQLHVRPAETTVATGVLGPVSSRGEPPGSTGPDRRASGRGEPSRPKSEPPPLHARGRLVATRDDGGAALRAARARPSYASEALEPRARHALAARGRPYPH